MNMQLLSQFLYMIPAAAATVLAVAMQAWNMIEIKKALKQTGQKLASPSDLKIVRKAINLSMQLAIVYLAVFGLLVLALAWQFFQGLPLGKVLAQLSVFGLLTLPVSIIGKGYEERIRGIKIQTTDPAVKETFLKYLAMWQQPRFKLPD